MIRWCLSAAVILAALVAVYPLGSPQSSAQSASDASLPYCYVMMKPKEAGGGTTPIQCYASQAELDQAKQQGNERNASAALAERQQIATANGQAAPQTCYQNGALARTFTNTGLSPRPGLEWDSYYCYEPVCSDEFGTYVYEYPYVPAGWNDDISSVEIDVAGCSVRMWDNAAYCDSQGNNCTFYPPVQTYCYNSQYQLLVQDVTTAMSFRPVYWDDGVDCGTYSG